MGGEIGWGADSVDFHESGEIWKGCLISLLFNSGTQLCSFIYFYYTIFYLYYYFSLRYFYLLYSVIQLCYSSHECLIICDIHRNPAKKIRHKIFKRELRKKQMYLAQIFFIVICIFTSELQKIIKVHT